MRHTFVKLPTTIRETNLWVKKLFVDFLTLLFVCEVHLSVALHISDLFYTYDLAKVQYQYVHQTL